MSYNSTATSHVLSDPVQLHGVIAISVAGLLSLVCTVVLLGSFLYSTIREHGRPDNAVSGLQRFLRSGLGLFLLSTFVGDALLGAAYTVGFHWVLERRIYDSAVCQFQAGFIQFSDFLTGTSTLALSIHTFLVLVPMRPPPRRAAVVTVPIFVLLSVLTAFIGPVAVERDGKPFYGVAGSWCYVSEYYPQWRFILLYDLIWTTMFVSTVCYIWIFLSLAGVVRTRARLTQSSADGDGTGTSSAKREKRMTHSTNRKMLFYPLSYLLVFLPISVTRIMNLCDQTVPLWLVIFSGLCLASSGTVNSILFVTTRRSLLGHLGHKTATDFCTTGGTATDFCTTGGTSFGLSSEPHTPGGMPTTPAFFGAGAGGRKLSAAVPGAPRSQRSASSFLVSPPAALDAHAAARHGSQDSGVTSVGDLLPLRPSTAPAVAEGDEGELDAKSAAGRSSDEPELLDFFAALRSS